LTLISKLKHLTFFLAYENHMTARSKSPLGLYLCEQKHYPNF